MATSSIGSPMLKARIPLLLDLPETSWFTVRLMRKDIQLALAEADRLAVPLPVGRRRRDDARHGRPTWATATATLPRCTRCWRPSTSA